MQRKNIHFRPDRQAENAITKLMEAREAAERAGGYHGRISRNALIASVLIEAAKGLPEPGK